MSYETILVEPKGAVTLVTLNRPQALNALNSQVLADLIAAFAAYDADDSQRCLVLTGSEKAFAAGADIKEMQSQGFAEMYSANFFAGWEQVTATRKPWIAAVAGFALGGGCEVAMMAISSSRRHAKIRPSRNQLADPGMGGSQRLTGDGKSKRWKCASRAVMGRRGKPSSVLSPRSSRRKPRRRALKTAEAIAAWTARRIAPRRSARVRERLAQLRFGGAVPRPVLAADHKVEWQVR